MGTPASRYGARVTFEGRGEARAALAATFGIGRHPWGTPDWVGVRVRPDGTRGVKAYHRVDTLR